jgi:phosphatidate phosphatase LPIN
MSQVIFQKPLSSETLLTLLQTQNATKSSWFSWRRSSTVGSSLKPKASEPNLGRSPVSPSVASTTVIEKQKSTFAKSLRLTSEQLKSLNLKKGANTVQFSVVSGFQGRAVCSAKIFLWDHQTKVVISDVDGTITKSDVLGHVLTMVGRDWTHTGVANYYTNIAKNGYQFLYLTSRAIGQASYTREYLAGVEQDQYQLPEGPVLLSPDRLVQAFTREVIQRKPQEFKISCLKDVKKLFGDKSPFYAGFGNRITDAISYRAVDVPSSRIFTIDPTGEVKLELLANFKTSYVKLNETVDQLFPPTRKVLDPEFTDFEFWKPSLPSVDVEPQDQKEESEYATDEGEPDLPPSSEPTL